MELLQSMIKQDANANYTFQTNLMFHIIKHMANTCLHPFYLIYRQSTWQKLLKAAKLAVLDLLDPDKKSQLSQVLFHHPQLPIAVKSLLPDGLCQKQALPEARQEQYR